MLHMLHRGNVPIHESILQEVKDKLFGSPFRKGKLHVYPLELVIAVQNGQPLVDPRNLQRVSPEEPEHAFLLWIAELLDAGVTENDRIQIRRLLLSVPLKFLILPSEQARYFAQANLREQIAMRHELESRTAVQKIFEFQMLRKKKNWKAQDIADRYTKEVEQAPCDQNEMVSLKYIENCFHIWDALFTIPNVQAVTLDVERRHAFWAVSFMRLYIDRGFMSPGEMTFRSLTGRNTNQKGWLDVVLEKKTVLAWLQGPFADKLGLAESHKAWKAACPPEAVSLLDFIWKVRNTRSDEAEQKKDEEAGVLATNHMQDEVGCNSRVRCTSATNHMLDEAAATAL
ncbi:unnamed protein product [Symbiodinium sp. KB8]|nr:unnamed protein product [Symbiodinium sp. KB8]